MVEDYRIHLNFLPVVGDIPPLTLYRRLRASSQEERPVPSASAFALPREQRDEKQWPSYWVLPVPHDGFDIFQCEPNWNTHLVRRMLFHSLKLAAQAALRPEQFRVPENEFIDELSFVMANHPEGQELVIVQGYVLRATRQFGFLVDFRFRLGQNVQFNRRVQQLSLSLDKNFRRNLDYYLDRTAKLRTFLDQRWPVFEAVRLPGSQSPTPISKDFVDLPGERLRSKIYIFRGGKESRSQFTGLREHGPLKPLNGAPTLLFAFREQDRQAARNLAVALRGTKQRGKFNFPGFKALFKTDLDIDADPIILPDLTEATMQVALEYAKIDRGNNATVLPVLVLPEGEDNGYMAQKALFSNAGMPTQVCTLRILQDEESLKWAIGNLALQIFCKAGGQPWKVRPTTERSLIIGISQSHKVRFVDDQRHIEKYFAFSVLTDSSGLFQQIRVLGDEEDHPSYIAALRANLKQVLEAHVGDFSRVVIHTSFRLKHDEMNAIQETVRQVATTTDKSKCRFAVIKVNHNSRFFGINRAVNSLVPFEATKVQLGYHEYLVWFEGIFPDKPNVTKAFPGPTHLQFLRVSDESTDPAEERELLQDLVNLSGANWRGFNAKSAPISVFYCHLVADLVHNFHDRGLPMPAVQDIRPWFL